ncbi:carbohydrate esterase family 1 protein [Phaffia rhodozyma]|uniref:S-formylglutathione hydrolase n=1 Tax=Phaffia rhodozyma TaxID=264483 RepID=A0A0F7SUG5_PHARH|nr:carbohydrate esterase family 1 protein [Phaffia rhodozyma]
MLSKVSSNKAFGGSLTKYKFASKSLGGLDTQFNVFIPSEASEESPAPTLFWLSGLTCNEDTGPWKSGILRAAAEHKLAVIFPDTSPRGAGIEGEEDDWDFGTGAGFYLNATSEKYKKNYNMYDLITKELPEEISKAELAVDPKKVSLIGHSMGGHGALTIYLKSPTLTYKSSSAFSPIANPTVVPWGEKAFKGYLASPEKEAAQWDASSLLPTASSEHDHKLNILITYGTADDFYKQGQLRPETFKKTAREKGWGEEQVKVEAQEGYDHSYYFISSFIDQHIAFHAKFLNST